MRNDVLQLVTRTYTNDKYGVAQPAESLTEIFCDVRSISQSEFFEGANAGIKPEYRFDIYAFEYNGEKQLYYNNVLYQIYRTYQASPDVMELYAQRDLGA